VQGKFEFKHILKIPSLHASLLGILVATAPVSVSSDAREFLWLIEKGVDLVGMGAIPLLIISFGYSLNNTSISDMKEGIAGASVRILLGPAFAFAIIFMFRGLGWMSMEKGYDLLGYLDLRTTEAIIVLSAAMPGPIMAYLLNVKFDSCPEKAAAMLFFGSVGGILTIPIVLHLINLFIFQ
ncbi:MAG: AEC family transporter, partial [Draconibacterium sp.]|nr:AEC family transporter [Draconibacterium sp.]